MFQNDCEMFPWRPSSQVLRLRERLEELLAAVVGVAIAVAVVVWECVEAVDVDGEGAPHQLLVEHAVAQVQAQQAARQLARADRRRRCGVVLEEGEKSQLKSGEKFSNTR